MKKMIAIIAATAVLTALTGCAGVNVARNYNINATGYAEISGGSIENAKAEALVNARKNIVENLRRFMEYKLPISAELQQKISYSAKIEGEGQSPDGYYMALSYDFDLYNFVAQNCDFKDIFTWQLLGMEKYYSSYIDTGLPIGIWTQRELSGEKRPDAAFTSMLSVLPCYSGNFAIGKDTVGGFFTAVKLVCLLTAVFSQQTSSRVWSGLGLAGATAFDIYSVNYEVLSDNRKLELFENAVLTDGSTGLDAQKKGIQTKKEDVK
jgi:hypothetical protein